MPKAIGSTPTTHSTTASVMKLSPPTDSRRDSKSWLESTRHYRRPDTISQENDYETAYLSGNLLTHFRLPARACSCRERRADRQILANRHHSDPGQGALLHTH